MSTNSETSSSDGLVSEPNPTSRKPNEMKKNPEKANNEEVSSFSYSNKEVDLLNLQNGHVSKKNPELCGVHSRSKTTVEHQTGKGETNTVSVRDELHQALDMCNTDIGNFDQSDNPSASEIPENTKTTKKQHLDGVDYKTLISNQVFEGSESSNNSSEEKQMNTKTSSLKLKDNLLQGIAVKKETRVEEISETGSQASLPDIVSSLNKTTNGKFLEVDNSCGAYLYDNVSLDKERSPKPNPFLPQTSNTQHFEALHNEMEMELKQLQSLKASQANQSIYKLAYDESLTDQSSNSRSPSPILSPEENIPCSFYQNEIIVHEAASDDDAGSEDVELIPHRYESESYLNQLQNKNLYVNKLSLAVELLRTQENLPYDGDFKRIVGENDVESNVHVTGNVNFGFKRDSCSPEKLNLEENLQNTRDYNTKSGNGITSQHQLNPSPDSNDSAIFSDIDIASLENESRESTKEEDSEEIEIQDNTDEIRAESRRLGIRARRQFALPFNPCFCCIIM